jgi:AcrR family transcriptional regulator
MVQLHDDTFLRTLYIVVCTILYAVRIYKERLCEMVLEYSGGGDPKRTMALLWGIGKKPTRGPKPGLSVGRIVNAAIEVADAEGLAALSMRHVADRLGISTMSLYTYVPGKAELIDVMLDAVLGEVAQSGDVDLGWRAGLERIARENWALYHRHPWMLQVAATSRPPLGPNVIAKYDRELRAVDGIGLTEFGLQRILDGVEALVRSR